MTIALFSDVHANLPAFEAFLNDLDQRKIDEVYCLGDLIGYHLSPNEVINEIRKRKISTIAGNHDLKLRNINRDDKEPKNYAYQLVSEYNKNYLTRLPAFIKLDFQSAETALNVVFAHGSTRSVNEYVLEDTDEIYLLEMMREAKADVLCVGHSHKPFHRIIQHQEKNKHIINIGSVGKPKDGNPDGCYVLLNINLDAANPFNVEFIRFKYDVEQSAKAIETSLLPNDLADRLRKAF